MAYELMNIIAQRPVVLKMLGDIEDLDSASPEMLLPIELFLWGQPSKTADIVHQEILDSLRPRLGETDHFKKRFIPIDGQARCIPAGRDELPDDFNAELGRFGAANAALIIDGYFLFLR